MGWRILLTTTMVVALFLSDTLAETSLADATHGGGTDTRRDATDVLNRRVVDFSVTKFHWEADKFASRFGDLLPRALAGAVSTARVDEMPAALVTADLFGTVNDTQLKAIFADAVTQKKEIEAKPVVERTPADLEYAAFLERVLWAGRIVRFGLPGFEMLDDVKTNSPKFTAFEEAFKKAFDVVLKSREDFHDLVEKINKTTDPAERARLQKELFSRFGSIPKFLDGQVTTSEADKTGEKVAAAVAQAISQKNAEGHNLEFFGAGDTPLRIPLGNEVAKIPEKLREARRDFPPLREGGFAKTRIAPEPHTGNGVQTFSGLSKRGVPTPRGDAPPRSPLERLPPPRPAEEVPFDDKMKGVVGDYGCVGCHDPGSDHPFFNDDGSLLAGKTAKRFLEAIDGCGVSSFMAGKAKKFREKLGLESNSADKDALVAWAAANGFEVSLTTETRTAEECLRRWSGEGPRKR